MKLAPNNRYKPTNSVTSWRLIFGNETAIRYGLADTENNPVEFIPIPTANGLLLAPKTEYIQRLEHLGVYADMYRHNNIFFGEILRFPNHPTFFATSAEKAEQAFIRIIDNAVSTP